MVAAHHQLPETTAQFGGINWCWDAGGTYRTSAHLAPHGDPVSLCVSRGRPGCYRLPPSLPRSGAAVAKANLFYVPAGSQPWGAQGTLLQSLGTPKTHPRLLGTLGACPQKPGAPGLCPQSLGTARTPGTRGTCPLSPGAL